MAARRAVGLDALIFGAILLALGALASWVGAPTESSNDELDPSIRTVLVDLSASVTRTRPGVEIDLVRHLQREASLADAAGEEILVVTFAGEARRVFGPAKVDVFREALRRDGAAWLEAPRNDLASSLADAARLAARVVGEAGRPPGTTVLVSDGSWTGPDPAPALLAPELGAVQWVGHAAPRHPDVALIRLRVPERVEPGAAARVDVDLARWGPSPGDLELAWRLSGTSTGTFSRGTNRPQVLGEGAVPLGTELSWRGAPDGALTATVPLDMPSMEQGSARLEVRVARVDGGLDAFPENDRAAAEWTVGDPLRVALVAGRGTLEEAQRVAACFVGRAFEGIEFTPLVLDDLAGALEAERPLDVVMTFGVGLLPLPQEQLARFVEEGGGYGHWAGWSRLVADAGPVAPLLALEPDLEPREPRDIVFVVDGSGSMKGARWARAKSALGRLLPSVPARDRFQLRFFTQVLGSVRLSYESTAAAGAAAADARRREVLEELRDIVVPGGATDITGSLAQLADELDARAGADDARQSLVILLSDGVPTLSGAPPERVREQLLAGGHEIVVIKVGTQWRSRPLGQLAGGGANVELAGELENVLGILQEAVQGTKLVEAAELVARGERGAAPSTLIEDMRELASLDVPLAVAQALPCRVAEGGSAIFELEPSDPEARRGTFAAVALRGQGSVLGVACPLFDEDGARWARRLEDRLDWTAPWLRDAGQRAASARADESSARPVRAALERARRPGARGATRLVVRGLELAGASLIEAQLRDSAGERLTSAALRLTPDPAEVGAWTCPRPGALDQVPRGVAVTLDVAEREVRLVADGPAEVRAGSASGGVESFLGAARDLPRYGGNGLLRPHRWGGAADLPLDALSGEPARVVHPLAPWLLLFGVLSTFVGAAGLARGGRESGQGAG